MRHKLRAGKFQRILLIASFFFPRQRWKEEKKNCLKISLIDVITLYFPTFTKFCFLGKSVDFEQIEFVFPIPCATHAMMTLFVLKSGSYITERLCSECQPYGRNIDKVYGNPLHYRIIPAKNMEDATNNSGLMVVCVGLPSHLSLYRIFPNRGPCPYKDSPFYMRNDMKATALWHEWGNIMGMKLWFDDMKDYDKTHEN